MEKFSQFRDKGSGIAPFMPVKIPQTTLSLLCRLIVFAFRLTIFVPYVLAYFLILDHIPMPQLVRKGLRGWIMGIPGIWWVDLQLDGVKRGSLARQPPERFPGAGTVIAANFTSPLDALYLACVFDSLFTISYPETRMVRHVSMLTAVLHALSPAQFANPPPKSSGLLTDLHTLMARHPDRPVTVFAEVGTTNGRGILPFSPSMLGATPGCRIFPVSLRYTPLDLTTPVPGEWLVFLWNMLGRLTHQLRVRIAAPVILDVPLVNGDTSLTGESSAGDVSPAEQRILDKVSTDLARLGRNHRVNLTMRDKEAFVAAWKKETKG